MTIVEEFLLEQHKYMAVSALAARLGVTNEQVRLALKKLGLRAKVTDPDAEKLFTEEYIALLAFVETRKEGVLVDIAKTRIKQLEHKKQLTHI